jgi:hypothetical protein
MGGADGDRCREAGGEDPWPRVADARRRMAEDGNRLGAWCVLRVGSVADVVRWDELSGDA